MAALTLSPVDALPAWHPDPGGLAEVTELLRASTGGVSTTTTTSTTSNTQAGLYAQLQSFADNPHFNNYLAYILARGGPDGVASRNGNGNGSVGGTVEDARVVVIRQAAGLLLKNNLRGVWGLMPEAVKGFVVAAVMNAVGDERGEIRGVAASCLGIVIQVGGKDGVGAVVESLLKGLNGRKEWGGENGVRGALLTFGRVAEDKPDALIPWLADIMEKVLTHVQSNDSEVRCLALQIINHYLLVLPKAFVERVDGFLRIVFSAANDSSAEVRAKVCAAVVILLTVHPHVLEPYLSEIVPFMLGASSDASDNVKYEAVEFWPVYCVMPGAKEQLKPVMGKILDELVKGIVYSEEEQAEVQMEADDDETVPDREQDIHPRQFLGPAHSERLKRVGSSHKMESEDESEEDIYDTDQLQWSVRRSCARALEKLASVFGSEMLNLLLPMLQEKLHSKNWAIRESAVLILGAVAVDCYDGMRPHLPRLIPFLISLLSDPHSSVRCISCWTLGRYASFSVTEPSLLGQMFERILECTLDKNKKVQKAAISSLCVTVEVAEIPVISPLLGPLLKMINTAFRRYQTRNFSVLCDLVATLANHAGAELANPENVELLVPSLMVTWTRLPDNSPTLFPLLGCLCQVVRALRSACQEYTPSVYAGCVSIISKAYNDQPGSMSPFKGKDEEEELIACALDLICAVVEALGPLAEQLVDKNLLEHVYRAMGDSRTDVRLAACELVGELARLRIPLLRGVLREYANRLVLCLNPEFTRVSNNATWALGELLMYSAECGDEERQEMEAAISGAGVHSLMQVIQLGKANKSLVENTAICLGRLACVVPGSIVERFGDFAERWFCVLRNIKDDEEKEQAFRGVSNLVRRRPRVIINCFVYFCDAVCSWWAMKRELENDFRDIFQGISTALGDNWKTLRKSLPEFLQMCLQERFGL